MWRIRPRLSEDPQIFRIDPHLLSALEMGVKSLTIFGLSSTVRCVHRAYYYDYLSMLYIHCVEGGDSDGIAPQTK